MRSNHLKHILVVLLAIAAPLFALAQGGPGMQSFKEGETFRKQQKYAEAVEKYKAAISVEGTNYRYYAKKGYCEIKLKKLDDAKQSYEKSVQVNKNYTQAYSWLAKIAMAQKDYDGAIGYLNTAYDAEGDASKKVQYKLLAIKLLNKQNRPQQAMSEIQKLQGLAPNDLRVIAARAETNNVLGNYDAAISDYRQAIDKSTDLGPPQKATYYAGMAIAQCQKGDKEGARKTADEFVKPYSSKLYAYFKAKCDNDPSKKYIALANGYLKAGAFDEAIENVNKAIETGSNLGLGYKMAGYVYYKRGRTEQAIQNFMKSAQWYETNSKDAAGQANLQKLYNLLLKIQFNAGDYSRALETANNILRKDDKNYKVMMFKAQAEYQLGQYSAAVASSEKAAALDPSNSETKKAVYYFIMGMAAKKAGDTKKATEAFTKVTAAKTTFTYAAKQEVKSLSAK